MYFFKVWNYILIFMILPELTINFHNSLKFDNFIVDDLKINETEVRKNINKIERYEEEHRRLWIKRDILAFLNEAMVIDENILFEKDSSELTSDDYTKDFEYKFLEALK